MTHNNNFGKIISVSNIISLNTIIRLTSKIMYLFILIVVGILFGLLNIITPNYPALSTILVCLLGGYLIFRSQGRKHMLVEYESFEDITESAYDEYELHDIYQSLPQKIARPSIYKVSFDLSKTDITDQPVNAKVSNDGNGWFIIVTEGLLEESDDVVNQIIAHEFGHISAKLQNAHSRYSTEIMFIVMSLLLSITIVYSVSFFVFVGGLVALISLDSFLKQYEEVYCDLFSRMYGRADNEIGLKALQSSTTNTKRNRIINTHPPVENRIRYFRELSIEDISFFSIIRDSITSDFYIR